MFWDQVAVFYDFFEDFYNGKVNRELCKRVKDLICAEDKVLECACGTGMLSKHIGAKCEKLIATDFAVGMLKQAKKNCSHLKNVQICEANIMELSYESNSFDKVVAGNVIHLLDHPKMALKELERVCKPEGKIIIPTYVNKQNSGKPNWLVKAIGKAGADFKGQFNYETYQRFFENCGYNNAEYSIVEGKIPCAIAVITKQ
ncbi:MAG: class I SAM-dependent methyltransferase [Clostridia bacterium]|nr:class I SAM-dependent methyltransferase [Clostridia bacterium]